MEYTRPLLNNPLRSMAGLGDTAKALCHKQSAGPHQIH